MITLNLGKLSDQQKNYLIKTNKRIKPKKIIKSIKA